MTEEEWSNPLWHRPRYYYEEYTNLFVHTLDLNNVAEEVQSLPDDVRQYVMKYVESLQIEEPEAERVYGGYVDDETNEEWWERIASIQEKNRIAETALYDYFRRITLDPKCLTPPVKQLAQAIYDERSFDRLPILADLLEEAGCDQEDILKHLRGGGEHVRGCWALDLILGRE